MPDDNTSASVVGVSAQLHWAKVGVIHAPERVDPADNLGRNVVGLDVVGSRVDLGGGQIVVVALAHNSAVSGLQMLGQGFEVELIAFDPDFPNHGANGRRSSLVPQLP